MKVPGGFLSHPNSGDYFSLMLIATRYVLANHYLLRLAERPPTDMAALLSGFHPVPPIMRKRAKELLDVIKDNLSAPSMSVVPATTTPKAKANLVVTEINTDVNTSTLWSNGGFSRMFQ
jgi:exosome complex exonuclease RRP6